MDSKTINMFPIREYLGDLNIYPAKERSYYGMYHSPFREDSNASMKVDYNKNLWFDYGANEGGTLIDLVMRIENCSNGEAMRLLEQKYSGNISLSFHRNNHSPVPEKEQKSVIQITSITDLNAPPLLDYLNKRGIDADIAKHYCKEINYTVKDKPYYGIGFQNQSGGYEIRNSYFKGCIAPKDISHMQQIDKQDTCYLFEGFMDYLSFLTIRKNQNPQFPYSGWQDYIILNSIANLPKAMRLLSDYEQIHCFLDNDTAGVKAYKELEKEFSLHIRDASRHYFEYKDLNDYLCGKKRLQVTGQNKITKLAPHPPKKKNRGFKM